MAKSLIINNFGDKKLFSYVPAGHASALAFCDAVLDGEYKVFEEVSKVGSDVVSTARHVSLMIQSETNFAKVYLNFVIPTSKDEVDVITALQGKTFNGVKADKVVIFSMRATSY